MDGEQGVSAPDPTPQPNGVGAQITDYANQVADINRRIGQYYRTGSPEGDDVAAANALKQQRDALHGKAKALTAQTEKAGAKAPDFLAEVKKASAPKPPPKDINPPLVGGPSDSEKPSKIMAMRDDVYRELYSDIPREKFDAKVSDADVAGYQYDKHYSDMPREQFDAKLGIKPVEEKPSAFDQAIKPIMDIPGAIGEKFSEGSKTVEESMPKDGKMGNPFNAVLGGIQQATSPATGTFKALVGDPARANLPDTRLGRSIAGTAEDVANIVGIPAAGALAGKAGSAVARGAGAAKKAVGGAISDLKGTEAKQALEGVRGKTLDLTKGAETAETQTAAGAEAKAKGLQEQQNRVRGTFDERIGGLQKQYEAAGKTTQEAQQAASDHAALVDDAKKAVDDLEKDLVAKPGITKQEFGKQLHEKTVELQDKYEEIRAKQSGYADAIAKAGDEPIVDTEGARLTIEDRLKKINTLSLDPLLERLKTKLVTELDGTAADRLSVPKADSLRKTLNEIIRTKISGDSAVDSETVHAISAVRDALDAALTEATPELKAARAKWAELSSPLNIVSSEGPLGDVVAMNPRARDAKMAGAEVAGHVIRRANEGHEVFSRLVGESPELRDSARLYFTQDLFGKGQVPTVNSLQGWLKTNSNSLKQLGLYDEFSSFAKAKATAQRAVKDAQGTAKQSAAEAKAAEQREAGVRKDMETASKRREAVLGRIEKGKGEAVKTKEKAESSADTYKRLQTEISSKVDKAVPGATRTALKKLREDGRIDDKIYGELLDDINAAEEKGVKSQEMRRIAKQVLYTAAVGAGAGYTGYRALHAILN